MQALIMSFLFLFIDNNDNVKNENNNFGAGDLITSQLSTGISGGGRGIVYDDIHKLLTDIFNDLTNGTLPAFATKLPFFYSLPKKLKDNPGLTCVVGLNTEADRLVDLRKNRMNSLKENENKKYTNIENIKKEILGAKKTFQKYKWPSIDVTRKSVEETAASIIKIYEIKNK